MMAEAMRAMVAACLLSDVARRLVSAQDAATAQRERIRRVIRDNIGSPTLGPAKICRLAGISRSQLYRLFEPHGGVARYIQAQRLRMAHAALSEAGPGVLVAEVAERLGFFDASAFSRAFRREFGLTPTEVRTAPPGTCTVTSGLAARGAASDFGGVLRQLGVPAPVRRSDRAGSPG
jgi:AraC-like DNA-binding protein